MVAALCACNQDDKGWQGDMTPLGRARVCLPRLLSWQQC
jgi:hypothetical protein